MNNQQAPETNKVLGLVNLAHKAGYEGGELQKAIRLIQLNENNYESSSVQRFIQECSGRILNNAVNGITPPPFRTPQNMNTNWPIRLGRIVQDIQTQTLGPAIGIYPIPTLQCINLISGSEGTGKTNLGIYVIPLEILRFNKMCGLEGDQRIGIWFVRTSKKSDENYLQKVVKDMLVFDHTNLKINPLYHKGHDKYSVFNDVVRLLAEVTFFREGTANNFIKILEALDKKFHGNPFSFFEVYEEAKNLKTKYEEVLPNRLQSILSFNSRQIFDVVRGIPLEMIAHDVVLFDFSHLDYYAQEYLAIFIFKHIVEHFRNQKNNRLNTVICFDEGDNVFSRNSSQVMMGYPTISDLLTTGRASGVGAVIISHHPEHLIHSLRSEAYMKVIFNLSSSEDIKYIASACSLEKDMEKFIPKLPNHHAIISSRDFQNPILFRPINLADALRRMPSNE